MQLLLIIAKLHHDIFENVLERNLNPNFYRKNYVSIFFVIRIWKSTIMTFL